MPRLLPLLLLLAVTARAGDALVYIGLNAQGAEEYLRAVDGAILVRVPAGPYLRRPYEGDDTTKEPESVDVGSFLVDKHEVTNGRFARFLNAREKDGWEKLLDPSVPGLVRTDAGWAPAPGRADHPVTCATGWGALEYAQWVGGMLPAPDQWMKAAGGPEGRIWPWGDEPPDGTRANFGRPSPRGTMPVGSFAAGASFYGCLDMAGNAYERVVVDRGEGVAMPVMLKGGSWLSPHPLNLRVLDQCMQPMEAVERSVGFRCVMADPEPGRTTRKPEPRATLRLATSWDEAVAEAKRRGVPIFLSLQVDTCGQCDRTRAELFTDPRFVAYCNEKLVVAVGHEPGQGWLDPHPANEDGTCPLYPGLECWQHVKLMRDALKVVERFTVSPGMFVLDPGKCAPGAGRAAMLVTEFDLPKWGNPVDIYLAAFERARAALSAER